VILLKKVLKLTCLPLIEANLYCEWWLHQDARESSRSITAVGILWIPGMVYRRVYHRWPSFHSIHGIHWSFQHQFRGFMFNRGSQGTREDTESPVCCCFLGQVLVMPILWLKHSEISSKVDGIITSIQLFHELKTPTKCRSILATAAAPSSSSSSWMRIQHRIPKECRVMYGNMEVS